MLDMHAVPRPIGEVDATRDVYSCRPTARGCFGGVQGHQGVDCGVRGGAQAAPGRPTKKSHFLKKTVSLILDPASASDIQTFVRRKSRFHLLKSSSADLILYTVQEIVGAVKGLRFPDLPAGPLLLEPISLRHMASGLSAAGPWAFRNPSLPPLVTTMPPQGRTPSAWPPRATRRLAPIESCLRISLSGHDCTCSIL